MAKISMLKRWRLVLVALGCALAIILTNCSQDEGTEVSTSPSQNQSGVLIYASGGQPVNLEPGNVTDGNSLIVQQQIYNRLLETKPGTAESIPALATSWESSEDGKTWTFKLREGVKFHDETDFNADAVKFNVERWWDADHPYGFRDAGKNYEIWGNLFGGFRGDAESLLQEIKVVDDYTIQFILQQPFAAFPAAIGSGYFGIASPTAIQKAAEKYGTPNSQAVGTGAFKFAEWRTGDRIILTNNSDYWQPDLPKTEQLVFRFITDPAARLAELRAGGVDFTVDLSPDQREEIEEDANLEAIVRPSFNVGYLALNPSYEPLAKLEVRQAIAAAINRPAIVEAFWGELATSDPHFTPPALDWSQNQELADYQYDPEKAQKLLAEAGYEEGFDLDLWYMPVSRPYYPSPKAIAEAFAADLSAVGIKVNLQTKDWAAYLEDRRKVPGFQAFMLGWTGDYGDPDNFYYAHFSPAATADLGGWQNETLLELLEKGRQEQQKEARGKIYAKIDKLVAEEKVRIPIVHSQPLLAKRKNIQGWQPSPLGSEPFSTIEKQD
ncbi:MAG: ABC transporter substrate-binding protein [Spirulinaceae cyanobacterium]